MAVDRRVVTLGRGTAGSEPELIAARMPADVPRVALVQIKGLTTTQRYVDPVPSLMSAAGGTQRSGRPRHL